jgi:hypothetical protein
MARSLIRGSLERLGPASQSRRSCGRNDRFLEGSFAIIPAIGGQSSPPIGPDDCHHGLDAGVLTSNRSPMRWPELVGRFHLPSAVCPPSVFGETPSGRVLQELESAGRARRANLHDTQSPSRGPKLVGGFHLPSDVCPPSERLLHVRSTFRCLRRELGRKYTTPRRLPSAFRQLARLPAASSLEQRRGHPNARNEGLANVVLGAHEPVPI